MHWVQFGDSTYDLAERGYTDMEVLPEVHDPTPPMTAEDAYRDHHIHVTGQEPSMPFRDLSDMAIQMYGIEANLVTEQRRTQGES